MKPTVAAFTTLLALALCGPASATDIDTNVYDDASLSTDPDISCMDASINQTNAEARFYCKLEDEEGNIDTNQTRVDMDGHAGCNEHGTAAWGQTNLSSDAVSFSMDTDSTGGAYQLVVECANGTSRLGIDARFQNSSGNLALD